MGIYVIWELFICLPPVIALLKAQSVARAHGSPNQDHLTKEDHGHESSKNQTNRPSPADQINRLTWLQMERVNLLWFSVKPFSSDFLRRKLVPWMANIMEEVTRPALACQASLQWRASLMKVWLLMSQRFLICMDRKLYKPWLRVAFLYIVYYVNGAICCFTKLPGGVNG